MGVIAPTWGLNLRNWHLHPMGFYRGDIPVDTQEPGMYQVTYTVEDSTEKPAEPAVRTVNLEAKTAPGSRTGCWEYIDNEYVRVC